MVETEAGFLTWQIVGIWSNNALFNCNSSKEFDSGLMLFAYNFHGGIDIVDFYS